MFRKGKIEKKTMQVFLNWFNASQRSYEKKRLQICYFCRFFAILAPKKLSDFGNCSTRYSSLPNKQVCKFSWQTNKIYYLKSAKNPLFWPIFRRKIDFLRFYPRKLILMNSKPLQIDFMVKNRPRKLCPMIIRYRAENPRKALY